MDKSENIDAIKVKNDLIKIKWDKDSIHVYEELVIEQLQRVRKCWSDGTSPSSVAMLIQSSTTSSPPVLPPPTSLSN